MSTDRHRQLIRELEVVVERNWAEDALFACLTRLNEGGLTERHLVEVFDAWIGPGDQISLVYVAPWGSQRIGLRRHRATLALSTYPDGLGPNEMSAQVFGRSVADWDVGEPIGHPDARWWHDSQGVQWWGDFGTFELSA